MTGSGFGASQPIIVTFAGSSLMTMNPASVATNSSGFFNASFTVPTGQIVGAKTVNVTDASSNTAIATFTVTPLISLNPTSGNAGSTVTVSGSGFAANSALTAKFFGITFPISGTASTNSTGSFTGANFTVPTSTAGGLQTVVFTDANSNSANAPYTVNTLTEQITVTMSNSAPSATVTVNGGYPTPSTFPANGASQSITMVAGDTFNISFSNSGNTQDGFIVSSAFSATSTSYIASATSISVPSIEQVKNTFSTTFIGGNPGSGDSLYLTGTNLGTGVTIATLSSSNSWSASAWSDYNTAVIFSTITALSTSTQQWAINGVYSTGALVTGGNTYSKSYYHQYSITFQYSVSGGGSGYSAPTATYTQFSTGGNTVNAVTSGGTAVWVDAGTTYSYTNLLSGSGTIEQWATNGATGTASASGIASKTYYNQYSVTPYYTLSDSSSPTVTNVVGFTKFGSAQTATPMLGSTGGTAVWVDSGSAVTYTSPISGTGQRWQVSSADSGTYTAISSVSSSTTTSTVLYYHQYLLTVTTTPSGATGGIFQVTYTLFGTTYNNQQKTTTWSPYVDATTTATVSSPQTPVGSYTFSSYSPTSGSVTMTQVQNIVLDYGYATSTSLNAITSPLSAGQTGVSFSGSVSSSGTAVPNGQNVVLQYSTSTSGPWTTATTVTTSGGSGAFSGTFTAPAAGTYYFQASFAQVTSGNNVWLTSTSSQQTIVVNNVYSTTTSLSAITSHLSAGQTGVSFSGSVSSSGTAVPNGQNVVLQYSTSTSGPWTTATTVTTSGGSGAFSGTFTAPAAGTYYFQASFAQVTSGYNVWQTSTSSQQTITVYSHIYSTSTILNTITTPLTVGQTGVAWSGSVSGTSVPSGFTVNLQVSSTGTGGWSTVASATTASGGAFSGTFTAPTTAGTWYCQAVFAEQNSGGNDWSASTSSQQTIVVNNVYSTTTSLSAITSHLSAGQTGVSFSGSVSSSGTAVPNGQNVVLQYSTSTSGPWTTATTVTTSGGSGAFSGTFTAPAAGTYYFQASFAQVTSGYNVWQTSTSSQQTITVYSHIYSTSTILNTITTPLTVGQTGVAWSGSVSGTSVPSGFTVNLQVSSTGTGGWSTVASATTASGGAFSGTFTAPTTAGTWYCQAVFAEQNSGGNDWSASTSSQQTIVVGGIVRVQGLAQGTSTSSNSIPVTLSGTPKSGDVLIAVIGTYRTGGTNIRTVSSISGGSGSTNTWHQITSESYSGSNTAEDVEIWEGIVSSGSTSVTITISGSTSTYAVADICEYSGIVTSSPYSDQTAVSTNSGTSTSTGTTGTTTQASELWIGGITVGANAAQTSPTNGFTLLDGNVYSSSMSVAYLANTVYTTGTASSGTTISSNRYVGCIATFEAS